MVDVRDGVMEIHGLQMISHGDPLAQLPHFSFIQDLNKFGLAGQDDLKQLRLGGLVVMGNTSEPVCEVPVEPNKVGIVLLGGLNPVAAAEESGIEAENVAMSSVIDYRQLRSFWELPHLTKG